MPRSRPHSRSAALLVPLLARLARLALLTSMACGGGGSGETPTPPVVDNAPASVRLTPSAPLTLVSGTTGRVNAEVLTRDGRPLPGVAVTWGSSDPTVASVQEGTVTARKVGSANVTASAGSITSPPLAVTVTAGALARLVLLASPSEATVGVPLAAPLVVELRDAADNVVSTATTPVSVALEPAGGRLTGSASVVPVEGRVTFAPLTVVAVAGERRLSFSAAGVPTVTSLPFPLLPGAPAQLALRTAPAGARVSLPLASQPVVELQDAGTNLVTTATLPVTVAAGGDAGATTLTGTRTVAATGGVATFTDLVLLGVAGSRTLAFSAPGVTGVTSPPFALAPGPAAQLSMARQPVGGAVGARLLVAPIVELRDVSGNVATSATAPVTASLTFGGGAIAAGGTALPSNGLASFPDLVVTGGVGERELTFAVAGVPPVTSARFTLARLVYGIAGEKIQLLDVGGTIAPTASAATAPTYVSRAPSLVGVDDAGRITARRAGESWVVGAIDGGGDSILTIVPRAAGAPILRTNLATYAVRAGEPVTVDLILDPRATPVGGATLFVTAAYDTTDFDGVVSVLPASGISISASQPTWNVFRFSLASATGISAPVTFGRLRFTPLVAGELLTISVTALDVVAPDATDLTGRTTSTWYPLVIR